MVNNKKIPIQNDDTLYDIFNVQKVIIQPYPKTIELNQDYKFYFAKEKIYCYDWSSHNWIKTPKNSLKQLYHQPNHDIVKIIDERELVVLYRNKDCITNFIHKNSTVPEHFIFRCKGYKTIVFIHEP